MSKSKLDEESLLFVMSNESDKASENVTFEFITKDNKIVVKRNNMITEVVKSDSEDYSIISNILESIDDQNKS